jgi:hypothetical protein
MVNELQKQLAAFLYTERIVKQGRSNKYLNLFALLLPSQAGASAPSVRRIYF